MAITQVQGLFVANNTIGANNIIGSSITANKLAPALTITSNTNFTGANTVIGSAQLKISSANTVIQGAHNNIVSANTVFSGHVLFEGTAKNTGTQIGFGDVTASSQNIFTVAQRFKKVTIAAGTSTATSTVTLNLANNNFFDISMANNLVIANPVNPQAANVQSGSIFLTQDGTGNRTVTFGSHWRFPSGGAPTLSTTANAQDRLDFIVKSANTIQTSVTLDFLGTS